MNDNELTPEAARALLAQEQERNRAECAAKIEQALREHGCRLMAQVVIVGETVRSTVVLESRGDG